ncbi:hypothetical protein GCM10023147_51510 [Tsukamurella soli]|uniref:Uncharacterized protein n=1 Tax=Tsukamurella soli TaxID=644556 RepID=A0ABP8KIL4_9ACTN
MAGGARGAAAAGCAAALVRGRRGRVCLAAHRASDVVAEWVRGVVIVVVADRVRRALAVPPARPGAPRAAA